MLLKKKSIPIFRIIISILFLVFLFFYIKPKHIIHAISETNPFWLLFALLLLPLNLFMQSVRWKFLVKLSKEQVTNKEIILSILYSFSYSIFTPGRLGEIGRAFHISDSKRDEMVVLAFYEKFFAFCSLMLFGLISLSFYRSFFYLLAVVGVLILMFYSRFIIQYIPYLQKFSDIFQRIHSTKIFIISLLFVFVYIFQFFLIINAFQKVNIFSSFFFISIVMLINAVPITFSGLGLRELVSIYFFKQLYISSSQAASASLLLFFINILIPTFLGFILHLLPTKVKIAEETK